MNEKLKLLLAASSNTIKLIMLIAVVGCTFLIGYGALCLQKKKAVEAQYVTEDDSAYAMEMKRLKKRKEEILENSYHTSLAFAKEYLDKNDLEVASLKYFDAKSIYPEAVEPRMALARIYFQQAKERPALCWQARKEILYAMKYIRRMQHRDKYEELLHMKSALDRYCQDTGNYAFLNDLEELQVDYK